MRLVSHPVLCNYYVTYRCNATCHFCDIWEKPSPYVTPDQVNENIRHLKRLGVKIIDFTGGEPLLHRQLPELLYIAKSHGMITTVTSNGLLYPKRAKELKGLIDMLHFSLDAADKATHDQMRGVACFDFVLESLDVALSIGERPDVLCTVFESNLSQIEKIYHNITLPRKLLLLLNPAFEYNEVDTGKNLDGPRLQQLRQWGKKPYIYLNDAFIELRLDGGNHREHPVCKAASTTIVITPENELSVPCYHLGTKQFPIQGNLETLYKSAEVQQWVALEGTLPECEGCAINCYMQPSFATHLNKYFWKALPGTLKYNYYKGTWKEWFR
ncbi:MAG: radical SAM protein [Cytophagaceae bacterium]|jgi:MoaA/NifB/PqqE/SkfB family radical SAM enzyme|nr:radical SAM protein [Cytophagaceae bacterium]